MQFGTRFPGSVGTGLSHELPTCRILGPQHRHIRMGSYLRDVNGGITEDSSKWSHVYGSVGRLPGVRAAQVLSNITAVLHQLNP